MKEYGVGYVVKSFVEERVNAYFKDIPKYIIELGVFEGDGDNERADGKDNPNLRDEYETYTKKDGTLGRRKKKQKVNGQKVVIKSELTNAELMFIMEYGSPTNNVPPRPALQKTIDYAKKNLLFDAVSRGLQAYLMTHNIADYERELRIMCERMVAYCKKAIRHKEFVGSDFPPNTEYTIKHKTINGKVGDIPLLDTGQLSSAITYKLRRY